MEVGGEGDYIIYTYYYTVTTRMISALRWAAMRVILMCHNCEGQSHKTVPTDHNFRRERRAEADSNRGPSAYKPNALPLGQTGLRTEALYIYTLGWSGATRACQESAAFDGNSANDGLICF